ncbi:TetR/AcrR family transcriptional regulator [Pedobacter sp. L105]|uniref:TetR/AcrR family transcriptional regulator n=1 Tax=Pedobacter sp. L105 TaxID=1641871 RepID=UPI00131C208C|nr:TetR/AcrR family transcriptional regulator [Pedobacter sp. L105]
MKESAARERILDVASRLFYNQGYNSTGINQIIDEAEIARASLYNHFPSKRDLLTAYIRQAEEIWFAEFDLFVHKIKDPKKRLLALFDYRAERQVKYNFGGCQFTKVSAEVSREDLQAFELVSHQKSRLKVYISEMIKEITLNKPQLMKEEMLAEAIFLMLEGATVSANVYKNNKAILDAKRITEKLL